MTMKTTAVAASATVKISDGVSRHIQQSTNSISGRNTRSGDGNGRGDGDGDGNSDGDNN